MPRDGGCLPPLVVVFSHPEREILGSNDGLHTRLTLRLTKVGVEQWRFVVLSMSAGPRMALGCGSSILLLGGLRLERANSTLLAAELRAPLHAFIEPMR
jgi:hypothetical protein